MKLYRGFQITAIAEITIASEDGAEDRPSSFFVHPKFMKIITSTVNSCGEDETTYTPFYEKEKNGTVSRVGCGSKLKALIMMGGQLRFRNVWTPKSLFRWDAGEGHSQHPVFQIGFDRLDLCDQSTAVNNHSSPI